MKLLEIIGGLSFMAALGIVGSVEHGADLRLMLVAFLCIGVTGACVCFGARNAE
jgi:hypothetical protein